MDEELKIAQPVPYEDGDHCIFYAVQAAVMFFDNQPLTEKERGRYRYEGVRRIGLLKKFVGKEEWLGGDLQVSLSMIINKLAERGIEPKKYYIDEDSRSIVESIARVRRGTAPIELTSGSYLDFELPALVFTQRKGERGHVWCPTTEQEIEEDYDSHISEDDRVVLIVELQKKA